MIAGLRSSAVFDGYRQASPLDVGALEDTILALGRFGQTHAHMLESVDLNPLIVRSTGGGAMALDALIQWRSDARDDRAAASGPHHS